MFHPRIAYGPEVELSL